MRAMVWASKGLAGAGRTDQQDVALGQLDIVLARCLLVAQALVVVVDRHRQRPLGGFLTDNVVVEVGLQLGRRGQVVPLGLDRLQAGQFVADDVVAQIDALVADEHRWAGDQLLDLVLALAAEGAVKSLFTGSGFLVGHVWGLPGRMGFRWFNDRSSSTGPNAGKAPERWSRLGPVRALFHAKGLISWRWGACRSPCRSDRIRPIRRH
jgi:hypothetical protein